MLFYYEYSKQKAVLVVLFNMLVFACYWYLFKQYAVAWPDFPEQLSLVTKIVIGVESVLLCYLLWRIKKPGSFVVSVSKDRFQIKHPTIDGFCIDVNPDDISKITHANKQSSNGIIALKRVWLKNGRSFELCRNYNYSLKRMYLALKQANPLIELPEKY